MKYAQSYQAGAYRSSARRDARWFSISYQAGAAQVRKRKRTQARSSQGSRPQVSL